MTYSFRTGKGKIPSAEVSILGRPTFMTSAPIAAIFKLTKSPANYALKSIILTRLRCFFHHSLQGRSRTLCSSNIPSLLFRYPLKCQDTECPGKRTVLHEQNRWRSCFTIILNCIDRLNQNKTNRNVAYNLISNKSQFSQNWCVEIQNIPSMWLNYIDEKRYEKVINVVQTITPYKNWNLSSILYAEPLFLGSCASKKYVLSPQI